MRSRVLIQEAPGLLRTWYLEWLADGWHWYRCPEECR